MKCRTRTVMVFSIRKELLTPHTQEPFSDLEATGRQPLSTVKYVPHSPKQSFRSSHPWNPFNVLRKPTSV